MNNFQENGGTSLIYSISDFFPVSIGSVYSSPVHVLSVGMTGRLCLRRKGLLAYSYLTVRWVNSGAGLRFPTHPSGGGAIPESVEWFIEGQAFSQSYDLAPRPPSPLPFPSVSWTSDIQEYWEREAICSREGGRGWARSRIIRPQESLVLYK